MSTQFESRHCNHCNAQTLALRRGTNHILHLILTILTFGLWLIIWALCSIKAGGWRCNQCGSDCDSRRDNYTKFALGVVALIVVLWVVGSGGGTP